MSNKTFILPERDEEVPVNHLKKAQRKDVDSFHVPLFPVSIIIHDQSSSLCLLLISFYKISELFFISKLLKLIFLRVIRACFFFRNFVYEFFFFFFNLFPPCLSSRETSITSIARIPKKNLVWSKFKKGKESKQFSNTRHPVLPFAITSATQPWSLATQP